ncbi:NAD-dependent protein deacetylase sirtuin-3, mitochondrial isoform X5 [Syngnathus typhle]|uniref:NAD-dependent protein deacetylase sirtuin-3, mitochondrial isoform X5 n=1 Tax=Syngnathus typhle TaxID=161592 RepID=UPI002A6B5ED1|nr:NAD-dependent protein deacetylase sirtuin-3, mitochondrial isoform X5 [Syngnathus typhle]
MSVMAYMSSKCFLYRRWLSRLSGTVPSSDRGQRSLCPCQDERRFSKWVRQINSPWWNATKGLFSRGGGASAEQQTLKNITKNMLEQKYKRVTVMAGAGISTPSGIPDFRSPGSGLYDNLQQYNLPYAEAIFELAFFHHNPEPFFALAKELYPGNYQPNLTHYFVRLLHEKRLLLRMYTQNIDGLERLAGIPSEMLVEAHDLLIIMGTSLEVEPFASLAGAVRGSVPRLLINRDLVGPFAMRNTRPCDVVLLGDVVNGVQTFVHALGWTRELDALMAAAAKKNPTMTDEE